MKEKHADYYSKVDPEKRGLWIHTYTAKRFYAFDPRAEDVDIRDIAHALALTCRYSGQCEQFYSVAQHSVILSTMVPPNMALAALLHDSPEAYLTDVPRPIKHMFNKFGVPFSQVEDAIYRVVAEKYGCQTEIPELVHALDQNIVADEAAVLFSPKPEWIKLYSPIGALIDPVGWEDAEKMFMRRFKHLTYSDKTDYCPSK